MTLVLDIPCKNIWVMRKLFSKCAARTQPCSKLFYHKNPNLWVDMWQRMKYDYTSSHQNLNDPHLSGFHVVSWLQSVQRCNSRLVMALEFWDTHCIIFIDYVRKEKTIKNDYYIALSENFKGEIAGKRHQLRKKKVLFHQDFAPCHKSMRTMGKIVSHPPCWMRSGPQRMLAGKTFCTHEPVIADTGLFWG